MNDHAEIHVIEPYVHDSLKCSTVLSKEGQCPLADRYGLTVMVGCVEGILGMRPDL